MKRGCFVLLLCGKLWAETCATEPPVQKFEIGASFATIMPSNLPDLETPFHAYGLRFNVPVLDHQWQTQISYGKQVLDSANNLSTEFYLAETSFALSLWTPYFSGLLMGGVHFMSYRRTLKDWIAKPGLHLGVGFAFGLTKDSALNIDLKTYLQSRVVTSFSATFLYRL